MNQIESIINDMGNDMKTLNRLNGVLFEQWQDIKANQFETRFLNPISQHWKDYVAPATETAQSMKNTEDNISSLAEELRKDAQNAQRLDIEV